MIYRARFNLFVAEHGRTVAVTLAIGAVLLLGTAGWLWMNPPTSTVTSEVDEQTVQLNVQTNAVVVESNAMWESGERLSEQPIYILRTTPTLRFEPNLDVPADRPVAVSTQLTVTIEAVHDDEVYWSTTDVLVDETETVTDGSFETSTELSVPALYERITEVAESTNGVGAVRTSLQAEATYDTGSYNGTLASSTPLHVSDRAYWLGEPLTDGETHSTLIAEEVTETPDVFLVSSLAATGLLALLIAGWTEIRYRRPVDTDALREEIYRHRYSEWISTGVLSSLFEYEHVYMDSLKEVADVAIDNNRRIIYDRNRAVYAVISEEVVFFYSPAGMWQPFASLFDRVEDVPDELISDEMERALDGTDGSTETNSNRESNTK